jgi:phasin family protein
MPLKLVKSQKSARSSRRHADVVDDAGTKLDGEPARAIVAGLQEVGAEMAAYAGHTLDQAVHLARSLIDAGSLAEVIALQQKFAQANFATLLAGSARVTEIGLRTGERLVAAAPASHHPAPRDGAA